MVQIAYFTELNLQICDYAQKRRICRENSKYALDENFHGYFCLQRKATNLCHPGVYNSTKESLLVATLLKKEEEGEGDAKLM